jgi:hypothetical protein
LSLPPPSPPKLPSIPTEPISQKKELLFSDDFERTELGKDKDWAIVVPTYSLENGALKSTQMRFDALAKDGKPAVKGHQAVIGNDIPTKTASSSSASNSAARSPSRRSLTTGSSTARTTGTSAWRASNSKALGAKSDKPRHQPLDLGNPDAARAVGPDTRSNPNF